MNVLPLLEKIFLLESKLGEKYSHTTFEPLKFDSTNSVKVQEAGKKISEFIGLKGMTFIISYTNQKSGTGGHIELGNDSEVFIEIDDKYKANSDIVLSILAHEICHKYLHVNNIQLFPEYENEILTDISTIYTGLGKLSLNGCETTSVETKIHDNKQTTTTTTNNVGYLNISQFAFAYKNICIMRNVPIEVMLQNLSTKAIHEINEIEKNHSSYFDKNFSRNEFSQELISKAMKDEIGNVQINFARLNKDVREIEKIVISIANNLNKEFHDLAKSELEKINNTVKLNIHNTSYTFIKNLVLMDALEKLKTKLNEKELYAKKLIDSLTILTSFIADNYKAEYQDKYLEFLYQFKCPVCNHKMRIGEKKLARVKCPQCFYSFIVNTGVPNVSSNKEKYTDSNKSRWSFNLFKKILGNN